MHWPPPPRALGASTSAGPGSAHTCPRDPRRAREHGREPVYAGQVPAVSLKWDAHCTALRRGTLRASVAAAKWIGVSAGMRPLRAAGKPHDERPNHCACEVCGSCVHMCGWLPVRCAGWRCFMCFSSCIDEYSTACRIPAGTTANVRGALACDAMATRRDACKTVCMFTS